MIISRSSFFTNYIIGLLNNKLLKINIGKDNYYRLKVKPKSLYLVIKILNLDTHLRYKNLSDISCVDFLGRIKRFQLNYILLSLDYNSRIIISADLEQNEIISSLSNIFNGSN